MSQKRYEIQNIVRTFWRVSFPNLSDLEWQWNVQGHEASRSLSARAELLVVVDVTDEIFLRDMLEYSAFFEHHPKVDINTCTFRRRCLTLSCSLQMFLHCFVVSSCLSHVIPGCVNRSLYWYFTASASLFCSWTTSLEPVTTRAASLQ